MSPGSAVMTEPILSHSVPKGIMVTRIIAPLWGEGWVALKVTNVSEKAILLRCNVKLADLMTCGLGGSRLAVIKVLLLDLIYPS